MKILRFQAEGMHGYLSLNLKLKPRLTFLTGINGSGKTSAVRAITALLTPSVTLLATMSYRSVKVVVEHEDGKVEIRSDRTDDEIVLSCSGVEEPLRIPILKSEAYEPHTRFLERQREFYREQEALRQRHPILLAIEKLPTPMFLDLERRHQEGTRLRRDPHRVLGHSAPVNPLAGSLIESLRDAESLGEQRYRQCLAMKAQLTDALKQEIILAAFRPLKEEVSEEWFPKQSYLRKIQKDQSFVPNSLAEIGIPREKIEHTVMPFFANVQKVVHSLPTQKDFENIIGNPGEADEKVRNSTIRNFQEWSAIQPQVRQINYLAEKITTYNAELSQTFADIRRYLASVNGFLSDSGKRLFFDSAGNLSVSLEGQNVPSKPITALSSGERQLVVILTHLAFNRQAKRANILIIDEPELSLHLRWQELFVEAVTNASPGLQVVLATHSPSIIGGRVSDCIDVGEVSR